MAQDFFLRIRGVDGDSSDSKHKGEIELESWSFGAARAEGQGSGGGGGGAGKVTVQDVHFASAFGKASPKLFLACVSGQHLPEAVLSARKAAGKEAADYLRWTFSDVMISSYQTAGSGHADVVMDQFSMSFGRVAVEYRASKADGTLEPPVTAGWDVRKNTKL